MPEFTARFIPTHGRHSSVPRWILRDAARAHDLTPFDLAALLIITDNLDARGVSRTSVSLISGRANIARNTAAAAVDRLVEKHLLVELEERGPGKTMKYAIPAEMPWPGRTEA